MNTPAKLNETYTIDKLEPILLELDSSYLAKYEYSELGVIVFGNYNPLYTYLTLSDLMKSKSSEKAIEYATRWCNDRDVPLYSAWYYEQLLSRYLECIAILHYILIGIEPHSGKQWVKFGYSTVDD